MVNVLDRDVFDAMLQTKWDEMSQLLATGNITEAMMYFSENTRDAYQQQFSELSSVLADIANEFINSPMGLDDFGDRITYELLVNRYGIEQSFYLFFERDSTGLWKIDRF